MIETIFAVCAVHMAHLGAYHGVEFTNPVRYDDGITIYDIVENDIRMGYATCWVHDGWIENWVWSLDGHLEQKHYYRTGTRIYGRFPFN